MNVAFELSLDMPEQFKRIYNLISNDLNMFSEIKQGQITNKLAQIINTTEEKDMIQNISSKTIYDDKTETTFKVKTTLIKNVIGKPNVKHTPISFENQLLDYILKIFTESGSSNPEVKISIKDFMKMREIMNNREEAIKRMKQGLETLLQTNIEWSTKKEQGSMNLIDHYYKHKDIFTVRFTIKFFELLQHYLPMPYPNILFTINSNNNPNSYSMLRKIAVHKHMNMGKKNEDIISVRTLIKYCAIKTAEERIKNNDRHIRQRIIERFEDDLDFLQEIIHWDYIEPITNIILEKPMKNYDTFISTYIKIRWAFYPTENKKIGGSMPLNRG